MLLGKNIFSFKRSIRYLVAISCIALLLSAAIDLYTNKIFLKGQELLLDTVLPIERAAEGLNRGLAQLLARSSLYLSAHNIKNLQNIPSRATIEARIDSFLKELRTVTKELPNNEEQLLQLEKNYQNILTIDQDLYQQTTNLLELNGQQLTNVSTIDTTLDQTQNNHQIISEEKQQQLQLLQEKFIHAAEDPNLLKPQEKFKQYTEILQKITTDPSIQTMRMVQTLQQDLAKLAIITRKFIALEEEEHLKKLETDHLRPLFDNIKKNMALLLEKLDTLELSTISLPLKKEFLDLDKLLEENNHLEATLRIQLNQQTLSFGNVLKDLWQNLELHFQEKKYNNLDKGILFTLPSTKLPTQFEALQSLNRQLHTQIESLSRSLDAINENLTTITSQLQTDADKTRAQIRNTLLADQDSLNDTSIQELINLLTKSLFLPHADVLATNQILQNELSKLAILSRKIILTQNTQELSTLNLEQIQPSLKKITEKLALLHSKLTTHQDELSHIQKNFEQAQASLVTDASSLYHRQEVYLEKSHQLDLALTGLQQALAQFWETLSLLRQTGKIAASQTIEDSLNAHGIDTSTTFFILTFIITSLLFLGNKIEKSFKESQEFFDISLKAMKTGDLQGLTDISFPKHELGQILSNLKEVIGHYALLIHTFVGYSGTLSKTSTCIRANAHRTHQDMNSQREQTELMYTTLNELNETITEIATNAEQAKTLSRQTCEAVQHGKAMGQETIQVMGLLAKKVHAASEVIQKLANDTHSIGSVLDVIRGVADQTNLLALNAAIEAARAGEQGRGFAVVADEVRTLASRTQESTAQIQQTILMLQSASQGAWEVMEQGQQEALNMVSRVADSGKILDKIEQASTRVMERNIQIASTAEHQQQVTKEIDQKTHGVRERVLSTIEGINAVLKESDTLSTLLQELLKQTTQFQLKTSTSKPLDLFRKAGTTDLKME